ncbi:MAG: SDR family oxidoreductase [bacterium]|nr:SDR family oxidoreductase [bacterium]
MRTRILVTGASGYLGYVICVKALKKYEVFALYNGSIIRSKDQFHWIKCNITDFSTLSKVFYEIKPNYVIHCAAISNVDFCEINPETAYQVNSLASKKIALLSKEVQAKCIYVSTDIVFDGETPPYSESDKPVPIQVYGKTKLEAEKYILDHHSDNLVIRPSVFYGAEHFYGTNFALQMISMLQNGKRVPVFIDQFRSPVSIQWLANSVIEVLELNVTGILHLAGRESVSRADFAEKLTSYLNLNSTLLEKVSYRNQLVAKRPRNVTLSVEKADKILSNPSLTLEEGFQLEWY